MNDMQPKKGEKLYSCTVCKQSFAASIELIAHCKIHTNEKPYSCAVCLRSFSDISNLRVHLKTHTGEKPYSCKICLKLFAAKFNMLEHMTRHLGEKSNPCKVCEKSFVTCRELKIHLRTHTGEKPYSCEVCMMSFTQLGHLHRHFKVHKLTKENLHVCKICCISFATSCDLHAHHTIHSNEKPYTNEICQKSLDQVCSLTTHRRTDLAENPYSCKTCNRVFLSHFALKQHLRGHTGGNANVRDKFEELTSDCKPTSSSTRDKSLVSKLCNIGGKANVCFAKEMQCLTETLHFDKPRTQSVEANFSDAHAIADSQLYNSQMHSGEATNFGLHECSTTALDPNAEIISNYSYNERRLGKSEAYTSNAKMYGCGICNHLFSNKIIFLKHCSKHERYIYAI